MAKYIETKRCLIRLFEENDIDALMVYRNNEKWMKYQGFKGLSRDEYKEKLFENNTFVAGVQLAVIRKDDNCLIGDFYLKQSENSFWIGYTIAPLFARQGYAFEAATGVIDWIKEQGFSKIMAGGLPENTPSIRLLEKLSFHKIGIDEEEHIYLLKL